MASELDDRSVLDAAAAGNVPAGWKVYHARKSYFYGEALFSLAIAANLVTIPGTAIILVLVSNSESQPTDGGSPPVGVDLGTGLLLAALGLAILALAAAFAGRAVLLVRSSRSANSQLLILMPDGFIARTPDKTISAQYADMSAVSMHVTHSKYDTFIRLHMVL